MEHMFKWMRENDECFKNPPGAPKAIAPPVAAATVSAIPNEFVKEQQQINKQLLSELKQLTSSVAQLVDSSKQAAQQTQQGFERMPKSDELLSQIETKLQQHSAAAAVTTVAPPKNDELERKLVERLGQLSSQVAELRNATAQAPPASLGLNEKDRVYMQELNNETLNALAALKTESLLGQQTGEWQDSLAS